MTITTSELRSSYIYAREREKIKSRWNVEFIQTCQPRLLVMYTQLFFVSFFFLVLHGCQIEMRMIDKLTSSDILNIERDDGYLIFFLFASFNLRVDFCSRKCSNPKCFGYIVRFGAVSLANICTLCCAANTLIESNRYHPNLQIAQSTAHSDLFKIDNRIWFKANCSCSHTIHSESNYPYQWLNHNWFQRRPNSDTKYLENKSAYRLVRALFVIALWANNRKKKRKKLSRYSCGLDTNSNYIYVVVERDCRARKSFEIIIINFSL